MIDWKINKGGKNMIERVYLMIIYTLTLLILLILQMLMPKLIRKNILFGVSIPTNKLEDKDIKLMYKGYKKDNLIIGVPALIVVSYLLYISKSPKLQTILMFSYIGVLFFIYLKYNYKAKKLKKEKGWDKLGRKIVVVDMKYSRDKSKVGNISPLWFLIPLGITLFNFILAFIVYPSLPSKIPIHWNFQGEITTYRDKSYGVVLLLPFIQLGMVCMFYFIYWMITNTKQQIDPNNPEESLKRSIIFKKAWSIYLLILLILVTVEFSILSLLTYGIVFETTRAVDILNWIILAFSIIGGLVLSMKLGQGGEKIKLKEKNSGEVIYKKDDDEMWKLGNTIYYNPEDSSVFVEKRFGIGWTVNAGRLLGLFLLVLPIIIIVLTFILIK